MRALVQAATHAWRRSRTVLDPIWAWTCARLRPFAPFNASTKLFVLEAALVLGVLAGVYFFFARVVGWHPWHKMDQVCKEHDVECGVGDHLLAGAFLVLWGYLLFQRREFRAAKGWCKKVKRKPEDQFSWLPPLGGLTGMPAQRPRPRRLLDRAGPTPSPSEAAKRRVRPLVETVVAREDLVAEIADDLANGSGPQILVADTGSGKTMILLKLSHHLAHRGKVAVAISLRRSTSLDFELQAREAYCRSPLVKHPEDAERHWHWMRRHGRLVVLVDDFEKAEVDPAERARALAEAEWRRLPVVVASRPEGLPPGFSRGRVDLSPLDRDAVVAELRKVDAEWGDGIDRDRTDEISELVRTADVLATPYYLSMMCGLLMYDDLPVRSRWAGGSPPGSPAPEGDDVAPVEQAAARLALLDGYRTALEAGRLVPEAALQPQTRAAALRQLEDVAYLRLRGQRRARKLCESLDHGAPDQTRPSPSDPAIETRVALDDAMRLTVLQPQYDDEVHFAHPTTLAYFASYRLADGDRKAWKRLWSNGQVTPVVRLAAAFANARDPMPARVRSTCLALLERASPPATDGGADEPRSANGSARAAKGGGRSRPVELGPGERMAVLAAAAEISTYVGPPRELAERIAAQAGRYSGYTGQLAVEKRRLVESVSRMGRKHVHETLWRFATAPHQEYLVRREAIRALVPEDQEPAAASEAVGLLQPNVEEAIAAGERRAEGIAAPSDDDRDVLFAELRAAAWILPRLVTAAGETAPAGELKRLQTRLDRLATRLTRQRGFEAAIAQGLKLDAVLAPKAPVDGRAELMAQRATFWYARLLALQAVAIRAIEGGEPDRLASLVDVARDDPHWFVGETAELCRLAAEKGDWGPFIAEDMAATAAEGPEGLDPRATRLIGDVVLLLNLNEQGDAAARETFGRSAELPHCLSGSPDRAEILGARPPLDHCAPEYGCRCPLARSHDSRHAWRELSRAFCRHQRRNATKAPWQPSLSTKAAQKFWGDLEVNARF